MSHSIGASGPGFGEVEVSIFGPGKGEALALHLGNGDWITVDSCRNQRSGGHPVLEYFDEISVDVASAVKLVVGTHSHDDHVAGIGDLFEAAHSARYVTTDAITSVEFFADLDADARIKELIGTSVRNEFRQVYAEAARRKRAFGLLPLKRASEQVELYHRPPTADSPEIRVVALSPSSEAVERARRALAKSVGGEVRVSNTDPNECSVALWVSIGSEAMLLGADLPIGPLGCGWRAVELTHSPANRASLFKVPHHGSPTSRYDATWSDLVSDEAVALIAPFRAGVTPRPQQEDVAWVADRAGSVYQTASTERPASPRAVRRAQADLGGLANRVWDPYGTPGRVTARRRPGDEKWRLLTAPPAFRAA